jgi:hypothetical protein
MIVIENVMFAGRFETYIYIHLIYHLSIFYKQEYVVMFARRFETYIYIHLIYHLSIFYIHEYVVSTLYYICTISRYNVRAFN